MEKTYTSSSLGDRFIFDDLSNDDLIEALLATGTDSNPEELERLYNNALSKLDAELQSPDEVTVWTEDKSSPDWQEHDDEFTNLVNDREKYLSLNKTEQEVAKRWSDIEVLRTHYALFSDFLYDCMTELMGFNCTNMQVDIGDFISDPINTDIMVQAQRSEAKSTIAAMFAVWSLIHKCNTRILIISAGSDVALEIANWCIQIIMNWDILACLRPDRQHGDRASTKAFDIHWQLKGVEKSPSIACIGITSNMQGRRADILISDDIESSKNGNTEIQRMGLEHLSRDFPSICQNGRIIYLGTPQSIDSIYNNLEERGFLMRIWPGRYPTVEEETFYGDRLAPSIRTEMVRRPELRNGYGLAGDRGAPTDPVLLGEEILCKKELDQGQAYFNLQHMLNTELTDSNRYPLNCRDLVIDMFPTTQAHGSYTWMPVEQNKVFFKGSFNAKPKFYRAYSVNPKLYDFEGKHVYIDTAGGGKNGDLTVAAVTYFLHGFIFLAEIKKWPGGYQDEVFRDIAKLCLKHDIKTIDVEKNFGFGAFSSMLKPVLQMVYSEEDKQYIPHIEDVWESAQKELRIIDTLEPIMQQHRLIVHEEVIQYDINSVVKLPIEKRESHKLFHQLERVSIVRGALIHDDSLDAFAGSVRHWTERLNVDKDKRMEAKETDENVAFFAQWGADVGPTGIGGNCKDRLTHKRQ